MPLDPSFTYDLSMEEDPYKKIEADLEKYRRKFHLYCIIKRKRLSGKLPSKEALEEEESLHDELYDFALRVFYRIGEQYRRGAGRSFMTRYENLFVSLFENLNMRRIEQENK